MSPFPRRLAGFTAMVFAAAVAVGGPGSRSGGLPGRGAAPGLRRARASAPTPRRPARQRGVRVAASRWSRWPRVVVFARGSLAARPAARRRGRRDLPPDLRAAALGLDPVQRRRAVGFAVLAAARRTRRSPIPRVVARAGRLICVLAAGDRLRRASSWTVLVLSYVDRGAAVPVEVLAELAPSGPQVFPFAVLGYLPRSALPLARAGGDVADHRADPHRARDVRVVHAREGSARRNRAAAHPRARAEGPVHRRSRGTGRGVRRLHRRRARLHARPHGAPAVRGVDARHRQARRAEPAAEQAGQAHRGGVRTRAHARRRVGADAEPHRLPAADRGCTRTATR